MEELAGHRVGGHPHIAGLLYCDKGETVLAEFEDLEMFYVLFIADHDYVEIVGQPAESENCKGSSFLLVLAVVSAQNAGNGADIFIGVDDSRVDHEHLPFHLAVNIQPQNRFKVVGLKQTQMPIFMLIFKQMQFACATGDHSSFVEEEHGLKMRHPIDDYFFISDVDGAGLSEIELGFVEVALEIEDKGGDVVVFELYLEIFDGVVDLDFQSVSCSDSQILRHVAQFDCIAVAQGEYVAFLPADPLEFADHLCAFYIALHESLNFAFVVEHEETELGHAYDCQKVVFAKYKLEGVEG